ncbi:hypothetical protein PV396_30025 [Streptomyces sp. ME02-8801-2C]|uniref:hypothetical protein n=1 Tax=Streptomyces sp. ME02-8801-2C TaxID=3028680 RepID=UPI0029BF4500|nr:hypothetical protein [Streptomyces sp. ME02-8801-2C]MDX3456130.1 hypothetical protein [Streptomyces sp. ME02-8801-2C]
MAEPQSNARLRADAGAPTSGVIHVRTRLTADFTVISNALAQRRGSAVTVGVAAYIQSLPDSAPVSIAALCQHFSEGEILISRALRELEDAGYLERRRERLSTGQIRTRTYFYDVPRLDPDPHRDRGREREREPDAPPKPRSSLTQAAVAAAPPAPVPVEETVAVPVQAQAPAPADSAEAEAPVSAADADPQAIAVLAGLRRIDPRLALTEQEAHRLAPGVTRWLAAGIRPTHITDHLTARLPDTFLTRPAGILAYRLKETPLAPSMSPLVGSAASFGRPAVALMQNCDGCDRAFRAAEPGRCRDCRSRHQLRAAG